MSETTSGAVDVRLARVWAAETDSSGRQWAVRLADEVERLRSELKIADRDYAELIKANAEVAKLFMEHETLLAAAKRFIAAQVDNEIATTDESEEYERALESLSKAIAACEEGR